MRILLFAAALSAAACSRAVPDIARTVFDAKLGVDLSQMRELSNGVYVRDVTVGTGDEVTQPGQVVTFFYTAYLPNGVLIQSNDGQDPDKKLLGQGYLIAGLEAGFYGMKVGGSRQLVIPPSQGYGDAEDIPGVPPESIIVFNTVTLLGVQ